MDEFFKEWLDSLDVSPSEYADKVRLAPNTVYRRRAGRQGCGLSFEKQVLMQALLEQGSPRDRFLQAIVRVEGRES